MIFPQLSTSSPWSSLRILLFLVAVNFGMCCGDKIDKKMEEAMKKMNVRGASLVFFDEVSKKDRERECVCVCVYLHIIFSCC
jgi:hypothetical protein